MMREVNDAKIARINGAQIKAGKTLKDHPNWMTTANVSLKAHGALLRRPLTPLCSL